MHRVVGAALFLAALASAACKTMKSVTLDQLAVLKPDRAWVTAGDQSVLLIFEPKVVGDTVIGYVGRQREKLPSAGFKQVRVQTSAPARTALLAIGLTAGLGGFLVAISGGGLSKYPAAGSGDCDKHPDDPGCSPM